MKITIDPSVLNKVSDFKIGVIFYENIAVSSSPQMIKGRIQLYQESILFDLDEGQVSDYKGIKEWRTFFKKLGMDPSKYRPSHEVLVRRIAKRDFLMPIHSAADINNFFSLQYGIPIGIYDKEKLNGDIVIRLGKENEAYEGLNKRTIDAHQKLISADESCPFGSPFVDSRRTAVTEETTSALQIAYLQPSMTSEEEINSLLQAMSKMFTQVNGGTASQKIVST